MIYPFMQSLRESPLPSPGNTVKITSFIPESGTEVQTHKTLAPSVSPHLNPSHLVSGHQFNSTGRLLAGTRGLSRALPLSDGRRSAAGVHRRCDGTTSRLHLRRAQVIRTTNQSSDFNVSFITDVCVCAQYSLSGSSRCGRSLVSVHMAAHVHLYRS